MQFFAEVPVAAAAVQLFAEVAEAEVAPRSPRAAEVVRGLAVAAVQQPLWAAVEVSAGAAEAEVPSRSPRAAEVVRDLAVAEAAAVTTADITAAIAVAVAAFFPERWPVL